MIERGEEALSLLAELRIKYDGATMSLDFEEESIAGPRSRIETGYWTAWIGGCAVGESAEADTCWAAVKALERKLTGRECPLTGPPT